MEIIRINEDNIVKIDPINLLEESWFVKVEDFVLSLVFLNDGDSALKTIDILTEKLPQVAKSMLPELYSRYVILLKTLKLVAIRQITDTEKKDYFKEDILDLFAYKEVDVKEMVEAVFKAYWLNDDVKENFRQIFLSGFEKNIQRLGKEGIKITISGDDKIAPQSIQNWIEDYNSLAHINKDTNSRGGFDELKYLNNSENAKKLDKQGRDVLLKVLQFYDWLKFDPLNFNFRLPEEPPLQIDYLDFKKPEKYISDDVNKMLKEILAVEENTVEVGGVPYMASTKSNVLEASQNKSKIKIPPQVPAPKNAPRVVPMGEVSVSPAAVLPPLTVKKQGPVQGYVIGAKNSNIQDLLKSSAQDYESRGLRMGDGQGQISNSKSQISNKEQGAQGGNPLPGDAGIKKQNSKEQEINKKLEDLGQRVKK